MAVLFVRKTPFNESTDNTLSPDGVQAYQETQRWQVGVDDWQNWSTTSAMLATGPDGKHCPIVGELHPLLPNLLRCKSVKCVREEESPGLFTITAVFGTMPESGGAGGGPADKWYVNVRVDGLLRSEDLHDDKITHKPVANSTGDSFDPPVKTTDYDEEISVEYSTRQVNWDLITSLRGKRNTKEVELTYRGQQRIFAPKTLKLANCAYASAVGDGIQFYKVSLILHARSRFDADGNQLGWTLQIVDRGFYTLWTAFDPTTDDPSDRFIPMVDKHGQPRTTPGFLNGSGQELPPGSKCHLLPFNAEGEADLNPLLAGVK